MSKYTPEQQREHRKLWTAALRSGEYTQAKETLRDNRTGGMCCLGVACDISGLGDWTGEFYITPGGANKGELQTPDVRDWLGLDAALGDYDSGNSLGELNDNGVSFAAIADIIEREPPGLLTDDAMLLTRTETSDGNR